MGCPLSINHLSLCYKMMPHEQAGDEGGTTGKLNQPDLNMPGENVAYQRARTHDREKSFKK